MQGPSDKLCCHDISAHSFTEYHRTRVKGLRLKEIQRPHRAHNSRCFQSCQRPPSQDGTSCSCLPHTSDQPSTLCYRHSRSLPHRGWYGCMQRHFLGALRDPYLTRGSKTCGESLWAQQLLCPRYPLPTAIAKPTSSTVTMLGARQCKGV